jgi:hypothetical protein
VNARASQYTPQEGDRVRVVISGGVTQVTADGNVTVNARTTVNPRDGHVVSVEYAAPPLPTTAASVVSVDGARWVRIQNGWVSADGLTQTASDDVMRGRQYRVLFDAATGA